MCPVSAPALRTDTQASRVTWRQIALSVRLRELRCSVLRSVVSIVTHSLTHSLTHSPTVSPVFEDNAKWTNAIHRAHVATAPATILRAGASIGRA
jgi:hypothetical protein